MAWTVARSKKQKVARSGFSIFLAYCPARRNDRFQDKGLTSSDYVFNNEQPTT